LPGRGPLTFKKKQRELLQKEKQAAKLSRRLDKKLRPPEPDEDAAQETVPEETAPDSPTPDSE
jgi:hypothetical protein